MRRTGTKTASVNNLTVDTAGLQSLLSAGYPTAVEIGTAAGARITVGRRVLWNVSKIQKYLDEIASQRKTMVSTGDRSAKIRTYNYPQGRVTDHRINLTLYNLAAVMDGEIGEIIEKLQIEENTEKLKESGF